MIRALPSDQTIRPNSVESTQDVYAGLMNRIHMSIQPTEGSKCLMTGFTSCHSAEGVSTVTLNIAQFCASELRLKVLLIDASGGSKLVESVLGIQPNNGLVQVLNQEIQWNEAIVRSTVENLDYLSSGVTETESFTPRHISDFANLLPNLKQQFDIVLVDLPPVSRPADGLSLAPQMDATVLVIQQGRTRKDLAKRMCQQLLSYRVKLVGTLMNQVENEYPSMKQLPADFVEMTKSAIRYPIAIGTSLAGALIKIGRKS